MKTPLAFLLFDTSGFPPRWHCGDWSALHGWVHVLGDLAIFGAYAAIPLSIAYFMWNRRKEVQVPALWWLFAAFIFSCGFTHLVESVIFWHPWYRFSGLMKVITAVISWATVVAIYRNLPKLLKLPGLAQLNDNLRRSEENLIVTLNSIGDAVLATDSEGRVTRLNPVAEVLTGWTQAEALGKPVDEVFRTSTLSEGNAFPPSAMKARKESRNDEASGDVLLTSRYGIEYRIAEKAAQIRDRTGGVQGVVRVFRDVGEARYGELAKSLRMVASIRFQSALLAMREHQGEDWDGFLRLVTESSASALGAERLGVWFLEDESDSITCGDLFQKSLTRHEKGMEIRKADCPKYFKVISRGDIVIAGDALRHEALGEFVESYLKPNGITSMLDVPIRLNRETVGVICCEHTGPAREWTPEEEEFLSSVAGIIEVGMENTRRRAAEAEVRRLNQNLERLVVERTSELRDQKELTARLMANLTDGVVACDAEGKLTFFNQIARQWHGCDIRDVPPEDWSASFDLYDRDGVSHLKTEQIPLVRALRGEKVRGAEMVIVAKGQAPRVVVSNGDTLFGENGEKLGAVVVMHDVTERIQSERILRLAAERARLAAAVGEVGIWDVDLLSGSVNWNDQMYEMYGIDSGNVPSLKLWEAAIYPGDHSRIWDEIHIAGAQVKETVETEFRIRRPSDGATRYIQAVAKVFRDDAGIPQRVLGTDRDITDERNREQVLTDALETQKGLTQQAEAGERAKSIFLAVMSHEIRTPMSVMLGFADLLRHSKTLSREDRDSVDTISQSGESLLRILDDVLDFSRLEAGQLKTTEEVFSPARLAHSLAEFFAPGIRDKSLEFEVVVDPALPATIRNDLGRTRQILVNLLSNAIKFTDLGKIMLEVRLGTTPLSGLGHVEFIVSDTGAGISGEGLSKIFQLFYQLESGLSRTHGGTGIGLAICRRLAVLMGGELRVESTEGVGSKFILSLLANGGMPEAIALPVPGTKVVLDQDFSEHYPLKILVAEDDRINLKLIVNLLRKLGYEALTARDGVEAVEAFGSGIDLILMDVQMPHLDGIEATRKIREREAAEGCRPVFIAALTANIMPEDRQKCWESGMNAYLNKPLRIEQLISVLKDAHAAQASSNGSTG